MLIFHIDEHEKEQPYLIESFCSLYTMRRYFSLSLYSTFIPNRSFLEPESDSPPLVIKQYLLGWGRGQPHLLIF